MTREDIKKKVAAMVAEILGEELKSEAEWEKISLVRDLDFDSLDTVELLVKAERAFSINITDAETDEVSTLKDVVTLIERHVLVEN